jgi:LysM repeat protein
MPERGATAQRIMTSAQTTRAHTVASSSAPDASAVPIAVYRIQPGDNPSTIAARFKVPVRALFAENPELEPTKLMPGHTLRIPGVQQNFRIVKAGDTIGKIASEMKIPVNDLLAANPKVAPTNLQIGQPIFLPVQGAREPRAAHAPEPPPAQRTERAVTPTPPSTVSSKSPEFLPRTIPAAPQRPDVATTPGQWKPVPVDPALLNSRFVSPLPSQPAPSFFVSVMRSLTHEGGLSQNSKDLAHQGSVKITNFGITGMAMTEYIKATEGADRKPSGEELTARIKALTYDEALDIYARNYWKQDFKSLDKQVAFLLFDWGVLGGRDSTLSALQSALGVSQTAKIDSATVKAMNALGADAVCDKITEVRIARHRDKVARVSAKIQEYDEAVSQGKAPGFKRPIDQSGHLEGWIRRARAVNEYAHSKQFEQLTAVFERTAPRGCDLMDPVRAGTITLKPHSNEGALIRMLQQRLTSVGYTVAADSKFGPEMQKVVSFFQEHYNLPRSSGWGPNEMRVLDALLVAKQLREAPALASVSPSRRQ